MRQEVHAALRGAADEITRYALAFEDSQVGTAVAPSAVSGLVGAFVPLLGGAQPLEIAVVGTPGECRALAAAMLQVGSPDGLTQANVADAVGEVVNMFAGSFKRRLQAEGEELELGLPRFVGGALAPTDQLSVLPLPARFGPISLYVVLLGPHHEPS